MATTWHYSLCSEKVQCLAEQLDAVCCRARFSNLALQQLFCRDAQQIVGPSASIQFVSAAFIVDEVASQLANWYLALWKVVYVLCSRFVFLCEFRLSIFFGSVPTSVFICICCGSYADVFV